MTLLDGFVLLATGIVVGLLNTLAGGGSFLSLPALIFVGLPPGIANGTNRVAILAQNISAVLGFHRHRVIDWSWGWLAGLPTCLGTVLGTWLALETPDQLFRRLLAVFMVAFTLWTLFAKHPAPAGPVAPGEEGEAGQAVGLAALSLARRAVLVVGFFAAGIYGGFIQAGVGFLVLALTSLGGLDLVRGNAVKVFAIFLSMIVSLTGFLLAGRVEWLPGLALGAGAVLGAAWGVRLSVAKGHRWIRAVVTAAVLACAVRLLLF
ncbi:MAG TPA: sulfite exporter TauE/SafE family protein [Thermoanaerobaculia bacterium]|nr:sulfite exporter TauE/SafE family protein [Thermoanaerobaculia bacterium]